MDWAPKPNKLTTYEEEFRLRRVNSKDASFLYAFIVWVPLSFEEIFGDVVSKPMYLDAAKYASNSLSVLRLRLLLLLASGPILGYWLVQFVVSFWPLIQSARDARVLTSLLR